MSVEQILATWIKEHYFWTDEEIANQHLVPRRTVNAVRRCLKDTPQLFERVLSGEISLYQATRMRRALKSKHAAMVSMMMSEGEEVVTLRKRDLLEFLTLSCEEQEALLPWMLKGNTVAQARWCARKGGETFDTATTE
jgi:hypothetical protein